MLDAKQGAESKRISRSSPPSCARGASGSAPALRYRGRRRGRSAPLLPRCSAPASVSPRLNVAPTASRLAVPAVTVPCPAGVAAPSPCFSVPRPDRLRARAATSHPCGPPLHACFLSALWPTGFSGAVRGRRSGQHRLPRPLRVRALPRAILGHQQRPRTERAAALPGAGPVPTAALRCRDHGVSGPRAARSRPAQCWGVGPEPGPVPASPPSLDRGRGSGLCRRVTQRGAPAHRLPLPQGFRSVAARPAQPRGRQPEWGCSGARASRPTVGALARPRVQHRPRASPSGLRDAAAAAGLVPSRSCAPW